MTLATCDGILTSLRRLQLLEEQQIAELADLRQHGLEDPRALAKELLRRDWVTAFQINYLLKNLADELQIGPYVLIQRLGEGGMGQVFKARHRTLGRIVAVKRIRQEALSNPVSVPRFEREIEATAQLMHPHIVRAFDAGLAGGAYYLAMEFLEGVDLAQLVKQSGPLPVPQTCDYIRQAALGLQYAHNLGFVHRDIKPANLFVTHKLSPSRGGSGVSPQPSQADYPWGLVKVLDFGLARLKDASRDRTVLTQLGAVIGTPDFVAPEQAWNSQTVDIRADLYSLGCTFYWLLAGRVPYPGGSMPEKLVRHYKEQATPVDQARWEQLRGASSAPLTDLQRAAAVVPVPVVEVLNRLMAKTLAARFQTPAELADALQVIVSAQQIPPDPPHTPFPTRLRRTGAHRRPNLDASGEPHTPMSATVPAARLLTPAEPDQTSASPAHRRRRIRQVLVGAALLACCGVFGKILSSGPALEADTPDTPPVEAVVPLKPAGPSAEMAWWQLTAKAGRATPSVEQLLEFRGQFPGSGLAHRATLLLMAQRSPLDCLEPFKLPKVGYPVAFGHDFLAVLGRHEPDL